MNGLTGDVSTYEASISIGDFSQSHSEMSPWEEEDHLSPEGFTSVRRKFLIACVLGVLF